jgi:hypothetical protein
MMASNMPSTFFGLVSAYTVLLQNWIVVLWITKLSFHCVGIFYLFLQVQCHGFIFLLVVFGY